MPTDAEIEAAVKAMRSVRTTGGKIDEEVFRAFARAALVAAERTHFDEMRKRGELRQQLGEANTPSDGPPNGGPPLDSSRS
jgi:HD-GYP domain-containing protein (c-di-GMP phosphodiesterase class II)